MSVCNRQHHLLVHNSNTTGPPESFLIVSGCDCHDLQVLAVFDTDGVGSVNYPEGHPWLVTLDLHLFGLCLSRHHQVLLVQRSVHMLADCTKSRTTPPATTAADVDVSMLMQLQ